MTNRLAVIVWSAVVAGMPALRAAGQVVTGEQRQWHAITLMFTGPFTGEDATPNPFTDYRLDVTFHHPESGATYRVPGFYAADGNAAETGATMGDKWHVHFAPDRTGLWEWHASFRTGSNVAMGPVDGGEATAFDGTAGVLHVIETDKRRPDFRARGRLEAVGSRYLRFAGDTTYFIKTGTDSPENFLAYAEFDNTADHGWNDHGLTNGLHQYLPHAQDWSDGDPTWREGRGKGIIGAVNYLASEGVNSIYFLTMNAHGDGDEVHPWVRYPSSAEPADDVLRFDVSKLGQWEIVFSHMTSRGVMLHIVTQETENETLLDGGDLGPQRRLYYRELIARFAHHPALVWNLGEENTNTHEQRAAFASTFKQVDPYRHPVVLHSYPLAQGGVFTELLGHHGLDGPSLQGNPGHAHARAVDWIDASAEAGRPWFVCQDEVNPADVGVTPDVNYPGFTGEANHAALREQVLWGNLMAGGAGVEWYFGYGNVHDDLNCEDFRSRDRWWDYSRIAREFFEQHVPFHSMRHSDDLLSTDAAFALAERDQAGAVTGTVLVYMRSTWAGGSVDLRGSIAGFRARWFNPRKGGFEPDAVVLSGGGEAPLPLPPAPGRDWALLLTPANPDDCDGNGAVDLDEIAADPSLDCNANGMLDACETDCSGDGAPDGCEPLVDCNGNGVPDACDIRTGVLADCDGNGVPDECDQAADCNGNGLPDSCERTASGLLGLYYRHGDLTGTPRARLDPVIDFDWGSGAPFADFPIDGFSARWTGTMTTPAGEDGVYTFHAHTNDGVRLWIGENLLIDEWSDHDGEHAASIALAGGTRYPIRVEHYEGVNTALVRLQWALPSGGQETVPASALRPPEVGCCIGDLNNDATVDVSDLLLYLEAFFQSDPSADRTGDAVIDVLDLLVYLDEWFESC